MLIGYVRLGHLLVEWTESGDVRVVRQDNGQHIELSSSEWVYLLRVMELRGWPIAPPQSALQ